jgi:hypothetical protein
MRPRPEVLTERQRLVRKNDFIVFQRIPVIGLVWKDQVHDFVRQRLNHEFTGKLHGMPRGQTQPFFERGAVHECTYWTSKTAALLL